MPTQAGSSHNGGAGAGPAERVNMEGLIVILINLALPFIYLKISIFLIDKLL
jgi:hypothetical protein